MILVNLSVAWIEACNHQAEAVAAERLPEKAGQLRVTVWNVGCTVARAAGCLLPVRQSRDDLSQGEQTLVDVDGLLIDGAGLGLTLRASEVDQLQFGYDDVVEVADVYLLDG